MKHNSLKRLVSTLALSAVFTTLCTPAEGLAKLDVPYGEDGAPPDSETQAEVDALNEALEGPEEGQTWAAWEVEFEAAYADLFGSASDTQATGTFTTVGTNDLCQDRLSLWVLGASTENVSDALAQPGARSALTHELESMLQWILAMSDTGQIEFEPPTVSSLKCNQCAMTYEECLALGNDWAFCKSRYLTCPQEPASALSISISVTAPASGTITINASAHSAVQLLDGDEDRAEYQNFCFNVKSYAFDGFSVVTQALIESQIENVLGDGQFCVEDR